LYAFQYGLSIWGRGSLRGIDHRRIVIELRGASGSRALERSSSGALSSSLRAFTGYVPLRFAVEAPSFGHEPSSLGLAQPPLSKFRKVYIHWDDIVASRPVPSSCDGLSPPWIAKTVIPSSILCSHYRTTFDPICMLRSCRVCPVIERFRPRNRSVDHSLGQSWVQSSPEQEDRPSGVSFPLRDGSEMIERCDVSVKIFSLHFDSQEF
jgi:hypothetical protein